MAFQSHVVECKEFNGKSLVYDFLIEDIRKVSCIKRTNKWLNFDNWFEIYDNLDKLLENCRSENLRDLHVDEFKISNAQVQIKKRTASHKFREIIIVDKPLVPTYLELKVSFIDASLSNNQKTEKNGFVRTSETLNESETHEYDPVKESKNYTSDLSADVPPYKPSSSKLNNNNDILCTARETYSPKPMDVPESSPSEKQFEISPAYKPSKINKRKRKKSLTGSTGKPTDEVQFASPVSPNIEEQPETVNRKMKKKVRRNFETQDLFGSDDTDNEVCASRELERRKSPRLTYKEKEPLTLFSSLTSDNDSDHDKKKRRQKSTIPSKEKEKISKGIWMTTKKSDDDDKDKTDTKKHKSSSSKSSSSTSKHSSSKRPPSSSSSKHSKASSHKLEPIPSEEQLRINREEIEKRIASNQEITRLINLQNTKPPRVEYLNLSRLSLDDLIATFDEFKPVLDKIFHDHRRSRRTKVTFVAGIEYVTLGNLIKDNDQVQMMNHLMRRYESPECFLSVYTELYQNAMLPEWALHIFMKVYKMDRADAIEHIRAQNIMVAYHPEIIGGKSVEF